MKTTHIRRTLHGLTALIVALAFVALPAAVFAADLTYTTLPQDNDSSLVLANKAAAAAASSKYSNITTAATTVVKSGSGILERIVVNTAGATSTWVAYDNTAGSGTKIASGSSATQVWLNYGCRFGTGLTVVTANGTPADITVVYR